VVVVTFAGTIEVACLLIFGAMPAWSSSCISPADVKIPKESSCGDSRENYQFGSHSLTALRAQAVLESDLVTYIFLVSCVRAEILLGEISDTQNEKHGKCCPYVSGQFVRFDVMCD